MRPWVQYLLQLKYFLQDSFRYFVCRHISWNCRVLVGRRSIQRMTTTNVCCHVSSLAYSGPSMAFLPFSVAATSSCSLFAWAL